MRDISKPNKLLSFGSKYISLFIVFLWLLLSFIPTTLFFCSTSLISLFSGSDLPSNQKFQMYPQDKIVPVGANTTFCCIMEEGRIFGTILTNKIDMNTTRLSRRSYAATVVNQRPSGRTGTNIICYDNIKTRLTGAVVFVGCKMNNWMDQSFINRSW